MHRAGLLLFCSVGTLVYKYSYLIGKIPFPEQEKSRDFPAEYTFFYMGTPAAVSKSTGGFANSSRGFS